ncbi:outer membrane protein assembly factor BamD [Aliarcobacter skirrowii]|uniref:outer membrane protein assembly factor BamD n=1 Tax=Aliarcobacter skirrowii TaxID=28200 RepID=UPI0029A960D2|nr:outer membrane protein assembly factor BamD [Aliarcobacter skirrowii]MDX3959669.1 outer membrane protein assembly factor BamD [Aliarcobacter skirrowii]MDX4048239.1 outer membrane protein assembly factor BamD [Aliarcobacter skirrowii]MDX4050132.1 outer membrane protein assembly factor BamD [Aliarcobacter skirrowii]
MLKELKIKNILFVFSLIFILNACSSKSEKEYNKPDTYWYNQLLKDISMGDLEAADDTFISLESEHRNSLLIQPSILILVNAHMQEEQYILANFYLDEYLKRFTLSRDVDYIRYLKIKSNFMGFKMPNRDQQLIDDTLALVDEFKLRYKNSQYLPLVNSINSRLLMARALMDKEISELYTRRDKPEASLFYLEKSKQSWHYIDDIEKPKTPFIRSLFE